jgi:ribosomal biogenesis protein LAS1
MSYENDLSLMYSTAIMRFLNHICNIGHTKEASLFKIANQLKIPEWIVNLRHQAAHGYQLPSISILRIAINVLFEWLHVCFSFSYMIYIICIS